MIEARLRCGPVEPVQGLPGLFRRKTDGKFFARVCIKGEKYERALGTDQEQHARLAFVRFSADPAGYAAAERAERGGQTKVGEAVEAYLGTSAASRKNSARHVRRQRTMLSLLPQDAALGRLTRAQVEEVFSARCASVGGGTADGDLQILRTFFRWCVSEGFLRENLAENIQGPKPEVNVSDRRRVVPLDAIRAITFEGQERAGLLRAMLISWWATGLRAEELRAVRAVSINAPAMELHVPRSKSKKGRVVPIADAAVLTALMCVADFNELGETPSREAFQAALDKEIERIGCARFTIHALRHSRLTLWANEERIPIRVVQEWAGHSSLEITLLYLHIPEGVRPKATGLTL